MKKKIIEIGKCEKWAEENRFIVRCFFFSCGKLFSCFDLQVIKYIGTCVSITMGPIEHRLF